MRRVAITGGIGEGKSTVLGYCLAAGFTVSSADEVARRVFEDPAVIQGIAELLGIARAPTRDEVRDAMAGDSTLRRALNRITHPRILANMRENAAAFTEVPLLIETCLLEEFDRVWVVTCGQNEQLKRLAARWGEQQAKNMLATQLPTSAKTPFADRIVRTNQDEDNVKRYVLEIAASDVGG